MKTLGLLLLSLVGFLSLPSTARSTPTMQWLGVAGLSITDGATTLLFDPVFTKPSLRHWILNSPFRSNSERVQASLLNAKIKRASAVFSSHTHFDHAVDIANVAAMTGARVYGGPSLKMVVSACGLPNSQFVETNDQDQHQIGKFKVTLIKRTHAPILQWLHWHFLPGAIQDNFKFNFYDYREGEVWAFFVEHPDGNILIDQGSHFLKSHLKFKNKVSAYVVGVSNKLSLSDLVDQNILLLNPKKVIPIHFDFFFLQGETIEKWVLPSTDLPEIKEKLSTSQSEFVIPQLYQPISL